MRKKSIILIIFFSVFLDIFAYINLSPSTLDKNIGVGVYQEFTLYNETQIPFRYKITPIAFSGRTGVADMSKWVEVYPKVVTVHPNGESKFKVYIKAPKDSVTGDYGVFLNIKQMSAPNVKTSQADSISSAMIIMVDVNLGVYGYIGDKTPKLSFPVDPTIYKKEGKTYLKMKIKNETNRLVRMEIKVEGKKGYYYPIGDTRAFKMETLSFDNEIKDLGDIMPRNIIITDVESKRIIKKLNLIK